MFSIAALLLQFGRIFRTTSTALFRVREDETAVKAVSEFDGKRAILITKDA